MLVIRNYELGILLARTALWTDAEDIAIPHLVLVLVPRADF
jgi:hypothetical protein